MLWTFVWIVCITACIMLFIDKWLPIVKTWISFPGAMLFLPLVVVTTLTMGMMPWLVKGITWLYHGNHEAIHFLVQQLPLHGWGKRIWGPALWISILTMVPTIWFYLTEKPFRPFSPPYWISHDVWLILIILSVL